MKARYLLHILVVVLLIVLVAVSVSIVPRSTYALSPKCDSNSTGKVSFPVNISKTLDTYSVWLYSLGTQIIDIGIDINDSNCARAFVNMNSTNFTWIKVASNFSATSGTNTLRIHSYGAGFSVSKGMLISDDCVPINDGSTCGTLLPTMSTTTTTKPTTTTTTTKPTTTTTTTKPTTTTTTRPSPNTTLTDPKNFTTQIQECWWLWCSVLVKWDKSTGGDNNITYKVTTDIREPEYTTSNSRLITWLPKSRTYPISVQAIDRSGHQSAVKTIYCKIP